MASIREFNVLIFHTFDRVAIFSVKTARTTVLNLKYVYTHKTLFRRELIITGTILFCHAKVHTVISIFFLVSPID